MADRLYLSFWLKNHNPLGMHRHFAAALRRFPFSTQVQQGYFRVSAVDNSEPALLEHVYDLPAQIEDLFEDMEKWRSADCCFEVESFWDLWQEQPEGWRLVPTRVNLFFYGPEYPSERGESIRIDVGLESMFLPEAVEATPGLSYFQSNIKSLLRLNAELTNALPLEERLLWSESPLNLSDRLRWMMMGDSGAAN